MNDPTGFWQHLLFLVLGLCGGACYCGIVMRQFTMPRTLFTVLCSLFELAMGCFAGLYLGVVCIGFLLLVYYQRERISWLTGWHGEWVQRRNILMVIGMTCGMMALSIQKFIERETQPIQWVLNPDVFPPTMKA